MTTLKKIEQLPRTVVASSSRGALCFFDDGWSRGQAKRKRAVHGRGGWNQFLLKRLRVAPSRGVSPRLGRRIDDAVLQLARILTRQDGDAILDHGLRDRSTTHSWRPRSRSLSNNVEAVYQSSDWVETLTSIYTHNYLLVTWLFVVYGTWRTTSWYFHEEEWSDVV